jgi:hypothetical protein
MCFVDFSNLLGHVVRGERLLGSFSGLRCVVVGDLSVLLRVCVLDVIFYFFQFSV